MKPEEIYSELRQLGFDVKVKDCRVGLFGPVDAPQRLQEAILADKQNFIDYVFEIEEAAAILEYEQKCPPALALPQARKIVNARREIEAESDLCARVRANPAFQKFASEYWRVFNEAPRIIDIEALPESEIKAE